MKTNNIGETVIEGDGGQREKNVKSESWKQNGGEYNVQKIKEKNVR